MEGSFGQIGSIEDGTDSGALGTTVQLDTPCFDVNIHYISFFDMSLTAIGHSNFI